MENQRFLKRNNGKISVLVHKKSTQTEKYHQKLCKGNVISSFFNRAYSFITNKDDFIKENDKIKQVLKENGRHYQ